MTLIGRVRSAKLRPVLARHAEGYSRAVDESERHAIQLEMLNREWTRIIDDSPYYKQLAAALDLPRAFESLDEYAAAVPETTKVLVQEHGERIPCVSRPPDKLFMTGGSTNLPVHVPYWNSEILAVQRNQWMARGWYGVDPNSRLFLLWGHSHLLGTGLKGWFNARVRAVRDSMLGYTRFSTYDMSEAAMREAGRVLLRSRPDYMLGFSRTLHLLAAVNEDLREQFRALKLKVIIPTSESFPSDDSIPLLEDVFGCPVAMEYGAAEVGIIGYMHPEGGYRAFWRTLMLEAVPTEDGRHRLLITSLIPRCFPLVRYEIGDMIGLKDGDGRTPRRGLDRFEHVVGRSYDYVELEDGTLVHFDAFPTALKPWRDIRGFQILCGDGPPRIDYVSATELPADVEAELRERLARVHPSLQTMALRRVETLVQTKSGKTKGVIKVDRS